MNKLPLLFVTISSMALAMPPVRPVLPPVEHIDTESTTNVPFTAWQEHVGKFRFSLTCRMTTTNNVQFAFGRVPKGEAGGIGMKLDLYVIPRTVSFSNIAMQETPCLTGTHSGYFDNPAFSGEWCHWTNHGAGEWYNIKPDNYFFEDNPRVHAAWPRMMDDGTITTNKAYGWQEGTMTWDIPIGWGPYGSKDNSDQVGVIEGYKQEFVIFSDGFAGVRKFSNQITRRTNDVVYLNGVLKP